MAESAREKEQKIQAALNQARKLELREKYGACFSEESDLPPDIEEQWLKNIEEFERQHELAREIKVLEFLGNPAFPPLDTIPRDKLAEELAHALEFLAYHDVVVDCLANVPDEDLYRFVTTELMQAGIEDIRIPGMTHHFIYEEFHPNDEFDAKSSAEYFLSELFARDEQRTMESLPKDDLDNPVKAAERSALRNDIQSFYSRYAAFSHHEFECTDCRLDGEYAVVHLQIGWVGLSKDSLNEVSFKGTCEIRLRKSPYGLYDVLQARFPGFSEGAPGGGSR